MCIFSVEFSFKINPLRNSCLYNLWYLVFVYYTENYFFFFLQAIQELDKIEVTTEPVSSYIAFISFACFIIFFMNNRIASGHTKINHFSNIISCLVDPQPVNSI